MDLVYECFSKLGLRYLCVSKNGKYAGMVCMTQVEHEVQANVETLDTQEEFRQVHA